MKFYGLKKGPSFSGSLESLPLPLLLPVIEHGRLTGNLDLTVESQKIQISFQSGNPVGYLGAEKEPAPDPGNPRNQAAWLMGRISERMAATEGTYHFTSHPDPQPRQIIPGQLSSLLLIYRGFRLPGALKVAERIYTAAFSERPRVRLPSESTGRIRVLGAKAMDLFASLPQELIPDPDGAAGKHARLLLTLWCASLLEVTPPGTAQLRQQALLQWIASPEVNTSPPRSFPDPLQEVDTSSRETDLPDLTGSETAEDQILITKPEHLEDSLSGPEAVDALLSMMREWRASDLFLSRGRPPAARIHGRVVSLSLPALQEEQLMGFVRKVVPEASLRQFSETGDLDFGYSLDPASRFRINLFRQQGGAGIVIRAFPSGELFFEDLGLPAELRELAAMSWGLILVTGATGSGKSTSMASLVHYINTTRRAHIVTIEDPIEFIHRDIKSRITQREVGNHTVSFNSALRHVLRESPDVIVIGEMRDMESMAVALSAALTGHLVITTLHTFEAVQTLQRIMGYFPEHIRHQVALDLSISLKGVISQRLLPRQNGQGRVVAIELLVSTPAVARLLREGRIEELSDLMRNSPDPRLRTFDRSLLELYRTGVISHETGKAHATNPEEFELTAQGMETGISTFRGISPAGAAVGLDIKTLLKLVVERDASDLHLTSGRPPILRIDGKLEPLPTPPLTDTDMQVLLFSVLSIRQRSIYELEREIDFAMAMDDGHRFRVNAYHQKGKMAASLRAIPSRIPNPSQIGIPEVAMKLAERNQGLLLVVGPTGSGKSTTLACMVERINLGRPCRIITVEDPIEFTHLNAQATVEQREVGSDTKDFKTALKYVLRQDPDVILVGEMRDMETVSAALTAAETGHLVLASLHTNDAIQTIDRIVDVFSPHQQPQVRAQLAASLLGVISQRLLPRKETRGRIPAFEIMIATPAIRHLIRDNKMHQAASIMETSRSQGMITMDYSLQTLYQRGKISLDAAVAYASNPSVIGMKPPSSVPAKPDNGKR